MVPSPVIVPGELPLLRGRVVVVTGSASGIGRETARVCAAMGASVIGIDRAEGFDHVDEFYRADLSDPAAIAAVAALLPPVIHGLANVAGGSPLAPPAEALAVNFLGPRSLTQALIPNLAEGAAIVNIGSLSAAGWEEEAAAIRAALALDWDDLPAFPARWGLDRVRGRAERLAKGAIAAWTAESRWAWADRGIRINAVAPGPVETPLLGDTLAVLGPAGAEAARAPGRPGRPADVAPLVALLLSDLTRWLTGVTLPADGGYTSHLLARRLGL